MSIPIFTAQLAKARHATNLANLRSAKAAVVSEYLLNEQTADSVSYTFDVASGKATAGAAATATKGSGNTCDGSGCTDTYTTIGLTIAKDGTITWTNIPADLTADLAGD